MGSARASFARIASIVHSTEDLEKVVKAMSVVIPAEDSGKMRTTRARGYYGNEIAVCRFAETSRRRADELFEFIVIKLSPEDRSRIVDELATRLDKSQCLHLRLDKQKALEGEVSLEDYEAIKVEIHFKSSFESAESVLYDVQKRIVELSNRVTHSVG